MYIDSVTVKMPIPVTASLQGRCNLVSFRVFSCHSGCSNILDCQIIQIRVTYLDDEKSFYQLICLKMASLFVCNLGSFKYMIDLNVLFD